MKGKNRIRKPLRLSAVLMVLVLGLFLLAACNGDDDTPTSPAATATPTAMAAEPTATSPAGPPPTATSPAGPPPTATSPAPTATSPAAEPEYLVNEFKLEDPDFNITLGGTGYWGYAANSTVQAASGDGIIMTITLGETIRFKNIRSTGNPDDRGEHRFTIADLDIDIDLPTGSETAADAPFYDIKPDKAGYFVIDDANHPGEHGTMAIVVIGPDGVVPEGPAGAGPVVYTAGEFTITGFRFEIRGPSDEAALAWGYNPGDDIDPEVLGGPATITINLGDSIEFGELRVSGAPPDFVTHNFSIAELGIDLTIEHGTSHPVMPFVLKPDKAGTFLIFDKLLPDMPLSRMTLVVLAGPPPPAVVYEVPEFAISGHTMQFRGISDEMAAAWGTPHLGGEINPEDLGPVTITINLGDSFLFAEFRVTGAPPDFVTHNFTIDELGIDLTIGHGESLPNLPYELKPDKAGTFRVYDSLFPDKVNEQFTLVVLGPPGAGPPAVTYVIGRLSISEGRFELRDVSEEAAAAWGFTFGERQRSDLWGINPDDYGLPPYPTPDEVDDIVLAINLGDSIQIDNLRVSGRGDPPVEHKFFNVALGIDITITNAMDFGTLVITPTETGFFEIIDPTHLFTDFVGTAESEAGGGPAVGVPTNFGATEKIVIAVRPTSPENTAGLELALRGSGIQLRGCTDCFGIGAAGGRVDGAVIKLFVGDSISWIGARLAGGDDVHSHDLSCPAESGMPSYEFRRSGVDPDGTVITAPEGAIESVGPFDVTFNTAGTFECTDTQNPDNPGITFIVL